VRCGGEGSDRYYLMKALTYCSGQANTFIAAPRWAVTERRRSKLDLFCYLVM
jgi:hypothetical protein